MYFRNNTKHYLHMSLSLEEGKEGRADSCFYNNRSDLDQRTDVAGHGLRLVTEEPGSPPPRPRPTQAALLMGPGVGVAAGAELHMLGTT